MFNTTIQKGLLGIRNKKHTKQMNVTYNCDINLKKKHEYWQLLKADSKLMFSKT